MRSPGWMPAVAAGESGVDRADDRRLILIGGHVGALQQHDREQDDGEQRGSSPGP